MSRWWRRLDQEDGGAVGAEFAVLLPVLLLVVFGIFEFGGLLNAQQGVHSAAREGARSGAVDPGSECARALSAMSGVSIDGASCSVEASCPGTSAVVTVSGSRDIQLPLMGSFTVDVSGRSEFRCEVD